MIGGDIGWFGLEDWWLQEFTQEERDFIEQTFLPLSTGEVDHPLTKGEVYFQSGNAMALLTNLSQWFSKDEDRYLAWRILDKAGAASGDVLDRHFYYQALAETAWQDTHQRDDAKRICIWACEQQIALSGEAAKAWRNEYPEDEALPAHHGYSQRAHIHAIDNEFDEAIALTQRGHSVGWKGLDESVVQSYENWRRRAEAKAVRQKAKEIGVKWRKCRECSHPILPDHRYCGNCGAHTS